MSYKIKDYIKDLQKRGVITFTLREIREKFPSFSEVAIRSALRRELDGNEIISARQGFYVIVPVGYALRRTVPPELYIDDLMKYLDRPYYVGLLNAAAHYGAAHQQPQAFSVITAFPSLRNTMKAGTHIKFIVTRKEIPLAWLKQFRTENGDMHVSKPELTAADLITYQKEIGGLNRAATILCELTDALDFKLSDKQFFEFVPVSTIQRLGYLMENTLEQPKLANDLYARAQTHKCIFQKIPLKRGTQKSCSAIDTRWKIIINERVEADDL